MTLDTPFAVSTFAANAIDAHCRICGGSRIAVDAAEELGGILLAECARCEHRWTAPLPAVPPIATSARVHTSSVAPTRRVTPRKRTSKSPLDVREAVPAA